MTDADPARVVADADVLAADLLSGGPAREALDGVRAHSWVDLVASDPLLDDAEAVVAALADGALAADWRDRVERERVRVEHAAGDHPALASAHEGNAAHVLSFDEGLTSAGANLSLQPHVQVSVRPPAAFAALFDPAALYEAVEGGEYPGPDRDPRE
jgi:hypothetical protein